MNGIEKITDRIAMDADQEAKALLDSARKQAAEIAASYEALADSDSREALAKGTGRLRQQLCRTSSSAGTCCRQHGQRSCPGPRSDPSRRLRP